jgi:hypothetical protein
MKGRLLLNVVIRKSTSVFKLFSGEYETLLIGRDALLVLDLGLDVVDGIGRLDFKGNRLSREGFDEDLHSTTETEDEVESGFLLNVIVGERAAVFELFASEDQALLVRRDAFFILDFGLDVVDGIRGLDFESYGWFKLARHFRKQKGAGRRTFASQGFDEDLHSVLMTGSRWTS